MDPRILIVEDEENVAYVIATALRLAGFAISETSSGRDALQLASENDSPDLIVLDVQLPDLNGFEVCRRLRFAGVNTPLIFLTAADSVDDRVRGLTIGGDDYLTKPFSVEELVARVHVILHRTGRTPETQVFVCGDLELDDSAHVVTQGGTMFHSLRRSTSSCGFCSETLAGRSRETKSWITCGITTSMESRPSSRPTSPCFARRWTRLPLR